VDPDTGDLHVSHDMEGLMPVTVERSTGLHFVFDLEERENLLYRLHRTNRAYLQALADDR